MNNRLRLSARLALAMCLSALVAACEQNPAPPQVAHPVAAETAAAPVPEPACSLKMGLDPYEPYQFSDMDGQIRGLDVELVQAIASESGCALSFVQQDWTNLLAGVRSGEIDLLSGASRNADRERYANFSAPYRDEVFALFVLREDAGKWQAAGFDELVAAKAMRVGITDGYLYNDAVNALLDDPARAGQFVASSMSEVHIGNLLDHKVDGVLEDPFVVAAILRRKNLGDAVVRSPLDFGAKPVHLMFSKQSVPADTVTRFDAALARLREDGRYQAIVERYLK